MEEKLNQMKQEHYRLGKDNEEKKEMLNKEIQKGINSHYLKNILLKYLTTNDNDVITIFNSKVHDNLLRVVYSALKFTPDEIQKIKEFRDSKSMITKVRFFFNVTVFLS